MRPFAPALALAILLSPYALIPGRPMPQTSSPPQQAPSILRLDPALDQLIAPGTVPMVAAGGFQFTEAPMWHNGRLWFVDEEADKIHALADDGHVTTLMDYTTGPYAKPAGSPTGSSHGATTGPNGMAPAPDGSVVAGQQYARDVVRLREENGTLTQTVLFSDFEGKHLNSPNDLVFAPDGSCYFTDPSYGLKLREKDPAKELPFQGVFHVRDGKLSAVIKDLQTPNGIGLSPDHRMLYVNNSGPDQRTVSYSLSPEGVPGAARNLIAYTGHEGEGVPDGLKVDSHGNVWTTGPGGIRVITPEGKVLGQIRLPKVAANLAWGGTDGRTLYITARDQIYKLPVLISGSLPVFQR